MQIRYYAQSAFRFVGDDGTRVFVDPYQTTDRIGYETDFDEADVVIVTHEHGDHNNVDAVPGRPVVVRGAGTQTAKGVTCLGISSYHDQEQGAQRGPNTIFKFGLDGLRVVHLGDQGCPLDEDQYRQIGDVDILIAPVGGGPTLHPDGIWDIVSNIRPDVVIPCHFKTPEIDLPIEPVETFLEGKPSVRRVDGAEVSFTRDTLPDPIEIVVLDRSR